MKLLCSKAKKLWTETPLCLSSSPPSVLPVNNKLFFSVRVNHDHELEAGLKSSLKMTMLGRRIWWVVKNWLQCKKFRHFCVGEGWWWRGTVFNRSDHGSPWVAACCQATQEIGFVVGEGSLQWLDQVLWILWLRSESTHCYFSHVIINSHVWILKTQVTIKGISIVSFAGRRMHKLLQCCVSDFKNIS